MKITKLKFETDFPIDFFWLLTLALGIKMNAIGGQSILPKNGGLKFTVA